MTMTAQLRAPFHPIFQRSDYRYLGIGQDKILRRESAERVERYKLESLGWEMALSAARKLSNGKPCVAGEGSGTGLARQPQVQGAFNCCFWVQVEGESQQWVVRFPLKGAVSDETTLARMRSEIATIQFLRRHTKIPVPALVGYNVNEDDFPLFMIMESVEGMRMTYLLALDIPPRILDQVCKDLARIHLELLSHPSGRIGMLDLSEIPDSPSPTLGPYSLDAIEHERDGVYTSKSEPFASAQTYYKYKCSVWRQRLEGQRNAITSIGDGRRKILDERILSEGISRISRAQDDHGPFYLVHPDLHASNVILHPETMHVVAIIDWEGACFLPLTSSCTPPKALFPCQVRDLVPGSINYMNYCSRSKRYAKMFSAEEKKLLAESSSDSTVAAKMRLYLEDDSVLAIWALDDVRTVDLVVWQHLAPRLFPDLRARLDATIAQFPEDEERAHAVTKLFADFALERLIAIHGESKERDSWIKAKLTVLKDYKKELQTYTPSNK
jgi:Phosphotransferase enzyme family